jgi:phosphoribosylformylglycinamidine synthase PurS subunit
MKIALRIEYRKGVEDPEASVVEKNAVTLGFDRLKSIKIAKEYVFDVSDKEGRAQVEKIARDLLVNPVIQQYTIYERDE